MGIGPPVRLDLDPEAEIDLPAEQGLQFGSRGLAGKSFLLSVLGATFAHLQQANVVILGGSQAQSKNVHDYMQRLWHSPQAPRHLLAGEPLVTETRLTTGNKIVALPASQGSVRGPHPEKLLFDETEEADLAILDAAMGQTMPRGTIPACTVLSSTHHYQQGTFTEVLRRAKERGWRVYEVCYRECLEPHGWLQASTVEQKRGEMTAQQFQVEVELQEPSGEARAIDAAAVSTCFRRDLGEYAGAPREYVEAEAPVPGMAYAHGADWARSVDWTEILSLTADAPPYRVVAYERMQRLPWPQMVGRFDARLTSYGGEARHDKTGLGDVVDGYLTTEAEGFIMVGRQRADLFSDCVSAIERGDIVAPFIASLEAQVRYCTVDDLYGCFDEETEALTPTGWISYKDLNEQSIVAAFDRASEHLCWTPVCAMQQYSYAGDMVRFRSHSIDLLVTPDHQMLYKNGGWHRWHLRSARDGVEQAPNWRIPIAGCIVAVDPVDLSEDELRIAGWLISEGWFSKSKPEVELYQTDRYLPQLLRDLAVLDLRWSLSPRTAASQSFGGRLCSWTTVRLDRPSSRRVREIVNEKRIPEAWISRLTAAQFAALFETLILGDGSIEGEKLWSYCSSDEVLIDRFQALSTVHGFRATKRQRQGLTGQPAWRLRFSPRKETSITQETVRHMEKYTGIVWCVTTDVGTVLVRRHGNTVVTGNSGHPPDGFVALALAYHAITHPKHVAPPVVAPAAIATQSRWRS